MADASLGTVVRTLTPAAEDKRPSAADAERAVRTLLAFMGENPDREGLKDTPRRVVKAYAELFGGYGKDTAEILARQFQEVGGYEDVVLVKDISFFSHCEHHMVPFFGKAHVAYYPNNGVVGLSKIARVVDIFSKRLQTQENLTASIMRALKEDLAPRGVAVMLEAEHMCMSMRGVQKSGVQTTTMKFSGVFSELLSEQEKFLKLVSR